MITENLVRELMSADLNTLYNWFTDFKEQYEAEYDSVRNGIEIKFDIYAVLENETHKKPKKGMITVENRTIPAKEFRSEMEARKVLMRKVIQMEMDDDLMTKPRAEE